jgi:hypothetical protein
MRIASSPEPSLAYYRATTMSEPEAASKKRKAVDEEQKPAASKKLPANNEAVTVVGDSTSVNQPSHCAGIGIATKQQKTSNTVLRSMGGGGGGMIDMALLTSTTNDLLDLEEDMDEEDDRQDYIRDMEQVIRSGQMWILQIYTT